MARLQFMPVNDFDRGLIDKFEGHDFEYNPANWERLAQELPNASFTPVNAFDRALVEKFDAQHLDYDAANWERLEKILPEAPARKRRPLWIPLSGIAAALALLISGVVLWNRPVDKSVGIAANSPKKEIPAQVSPVQNPGTVPTISGPVEARVLPNVPVQYSPSVSSSTTVAATTQTIPNLVSQPAPIETYPSPLYSSQLQTQPITSTATNHLLPQFALPQLVPIAASEPAAIYPSQQQRTQPIASTTASHLLPQFAIEQFAPVAASEPAAIYPSQLQTQPITSTPTNHLLPQVALSQFVSIAASETPVAPLNEVNARPIVVQSNHVINTSPITVQAEQPKVNMTTPVAMTTKQERLIDVDPDNVHVGGSRKAVLSLAGGYNQGNSNMGYMVGVNARKGLGSKVYIEGDVAFASSHNAQTTQSMATNAYDAYQNFAPQNFAAGAKSAMPSETVGDLHYLQVTPVVGYQVFKNWSLGAGADIQRLFQDKGTTVYVSQPGEASTKAIPFTDMGVVAKTEYTIYRSVKAGLQYRYGMNEVLSPSKNYMNRSYLQVQLKVGIIGNK